MCEYDITDVTRIADLMREQMNTLKLKGGNLINTLKRKVDDNSTSRDARHCDFCNKDGHTSDRCWFHPDSPSYRFCTICNCAGHKATSCRKKPKKEKKENNFRKKGKMAAKRTVAFVGKPDAPGPSTGADFVEFAESDSE